MVNQALFPEEALVEIQKKGEAPINVTTDIDSFSEGGFERDVEFRDFFHNSKVTIKQSQSEGEITFNAKVTQALWDQILYGGTGCDFTSGGAQNDYRVTLLVTKDPAYTTLSANTIASGAVSTGYDTYRKVYADAVMTSFNPTLEIDGLLEGEVTFMVPPTDADSDPNIRIQIGSEGFASIGSYTTVQKWTA